VSDPAAFLRARLDEDEDLATLARPEFFTPECLAVFASAGDAAHVIRHDPARVLREVEAKRAILALHGIRRIGTWPVCTHCRPVDLVHTDDLTSESWPCRTLRQLAAVYSDHPGYDPAWTMSASG
jgi:Family of unknown function (DUF6221)